MSGYHHHHGHHGHGHHHQEQQYALAGYPQPGYGGYPGYVQPSPYGAVQSYAQEGRMEAVNRLYSQEKMHKKHEHMAEMGALGAAAYAMHEHHQVKVDPQHAGRHRMEDSMAGAAAVGLGGYVLHEHQQARHDHQRLQAMDYSPESHKKKHGHGLVH